MDKLTVMFQNHKHRIPPEFHGAFDNILPSQTVEGNKEFGEPTDGIIYFIRHGSTELNEKDSLRGWMDIPLSPKGRDQAEHAEKFIKDTKISRIITSDLKRCVETAEIINVQLNVPIENTPDLRPINFGDLNGQPMDIVGPIMDEFNEQWALNKDYKKYNSESFNEFEQRNLRALRYIFDSLKSKENIAIVGSLRNCEFFLSLALNGTQPLSSRDIKKMAILQQEPGTISELHHTDHILSFIRLIHV